MFTIKIDTSELDKKVDALTRDAIPSAVMVAVTRTAYEARQDAQAAMRTSLQSPSPFTLGSLRVIPATRAKLEAHLVIRDRSYMRHQIWGGTRQMKGTERKLQNRWWTPGRGAPLNQYGNVPQSTLSAIIRGIDPETASAFAAKRAAAAAAKGKKARKLNSPYYALWEKTNGRPAGVYKRRSSGNDALVLVFTHQRPVYSRRYDFTDIARRTFNRRFKPQFDIALGQAIGRRLGRMAK